LDANVEAHALEGMLGAGRREPPGHQAVHPHPVEAVALAAAPELLEPVPRHLDTKCRHCVGVGGWKTVALVGRRYSDSNLPELQEGIRPLFGD